MNYNQAVDYILQIPKFTSKSDLSETKHLLKALGNPEEAFKVIHVAGTNGKGSVCFYLDTLLQSEGKTVGRFTSPHLQRMNERMMINGEEVRDDDFLESFSQVLQVVKKLESEGMPHPTFFEFIFAVALLTFKKAKVEFAVLETGLGGRLDATNAVERPLVTAITAIGYDHMKQLGNTLGKIASEKAGIIKSEVPLVYASTSKESDDVIEARAKESNSPYVKVTTKDYQILKRENNSVVFSIKNGYYGKGLWTLPSKGMYQPHNVLVALEIMRILSHEENKDVLEMKRAQRQIDKRDSKVEVSRWQVALAGAVWQGRMEEVKERVFLDGAHNLSAITGFVKSIVHETSPKIIIFGAVKDKDIEGMIKELASGLVNGNVEQYIVTKVSDTRAMTANGLAELFTKYTNKPIIVKEQPKEAITYALANQAKGEVYCLGSLYLIGELRKMLK